MVIIMSTQSYPSLAPSVTEGPSRPLVPWLKPIGRIRAVVQRRRELRHLIDMNDRLLADVGITSEQVDAARKVYWI
jgi:uncharacterized protein YjiS (DUF1127 family)